MKLINHSVMLFKIHNILFRTLWVTTFLGTATIQSLLILASVRMIVDLLAYTMIYVFRAHGSSTKVVMIAFHMCWVIHLSDFIGLQKSCNGHKFRYTKYTSSSHLCSWGWLHQTTITPQTRLSECSSACAFREQQFSQMWDCEVCILIFEDRRVPHSFETKPHLLTLAQMQYMYTFVQVL